MRLRYKVQGGHRDGLLGVQSYLKTHPHHGQPTRLADSVLGRVPDRDQGKGLAGVDSNRASLWLDFKLPGANV